MISVLGTQPPLVSHFHSLCREAANGGSSQDRRNYSFGDSTYLTRSKTQIPVDVEEDNASTLMSAFNEDKETYDKVLYKNPSKIAK